MTITTDRNLIGELLRDRYKVIALLGKQIVYLLSKLLVSPLRMCVKARNQKASIRLVRTADQSVQLYLTAPIQQLDSTRKHPTTQQLNPLQISAAPLKQVTLHKRNWPLLTQFTFTLPSKKYNESHRIELLCNPEEAKWLSTYLTQWGLELTNT